jgi:hypothetical protein
MMMMVVFAGLISGYAVYGHFLGGIDGLTPLPVDYWPPTGPPSPVPPAPARGNSAETSLRMAFHEECDELKRINKLEIPSRHMVLAVDKFEPVSEQDPEHQGQVLLEPFSLAIFGKDGEINTIRSKHAFLKFDRPISSISEVGKAKIVAAELKEDVVIVNNRRTPEQQDDLFLSTQGRLYYEESKHLIYTPDEVRLQDSQSKPQPTNITAVGMDVYLTPPETPGAGNDLANPALAKKGKSPSHTRKTQPDTISGVDRIELRKNVQMDLYVDPRSGFMSANTAPKVSKPVAAGDPISGHPHSDPTAVAKDHVQITTQGPFTYDVHRDLAVFEISHRPAFLPSRVHVTRTHLETDNKDELYCDQLELQFLHKEARSGQALPSDSEDRSLALEIDTAYAVQLLDAPVELISYDEVFNASCHDLKYEARTKKTTLRGNNGKPDVVALKDGNMIKAVKLEMIAADQMTPQQAFATGPGQIDMVDKATGNKTLHARWKDLLTSTKDGPYDLLILSGDAAFTDDGGSDKPAQELLADRIKVWLEPAKQAVPAPATPQPGAAEPQQRLRPHHLEATNHVRLISTEMNLKQVDHLVIWFQDAPQGDLAPGNPGMNPGEIPGSGPVASSASTLLDPRGSGKAPASLLTSKQAPAKSNETSRFSADQKTTPAAKPKKPLNLEARDVKAHILRTPTKNDLQSLECQGTVRVQQEPATPEDKGVDIRGDHLQLNHFAEGNILVVTGSPRELGRVQLDKLTIQGKIVNIDQRANRSWVNDIGVMQILSASDFEGNKLSQPTQLTIHWNKEMTFDGKTAIFSGGVTAEQNNSRLACQEMQAVLDRPVSFKEGEKNGPPAKVERLVCAHQNNDLVIVEDTKFEGSKVVGYQKLLAQEVYVDNKEGKMQATGPGILNLLQLGTAEDDPLAGSTNKKTSQSKNAPRGKEELQLTRVIYVGRLHTDNKQRIATFYDDVEVYHGPSDDPDIPLDKAHLPPGFMYMRCKMLKVWSEALPNGQKNQRMLATGQVRIRSVDYWGDAQAIKYDEGTDWIILDGGESYAHLYHVLAPGAEPEKLEGRKIQYNRKDKTNRIEGGQKIEGSR